MGEINKFSPGADKFIKKDNTETDADLHIIVKYREIKVYG